MALGLASGGHAVAVRRFDRAAGRRMHAISAHVALRAAGEDYGYPQLSRLLRRLAPAAQGLGYQAMIVGDAGVEASLENALSQVKAFGMKEAAAREAVREVAAAVDGWKDHFRHAGVAGADIDILAQYIDGPRLGAQRAGALRHRARR